MDKFRLLMVSLLVLSLVALLPLPSSVKANGTTAVFYSDTDDGAVRSPLAGSSNYETIRNASSGNVAGPVDIGQVFFGGNYYIWRGILFFDTSIIPDSAVIMGVTLSLCLSGDYSDTDFNVTVQNGQPTYPHKPLQDGDYYHMHYSGDGGQFNTSNLVAGYNNITLNAEGESWVNLEGVTKFCLRSSRDINNIEPVGKEEVVFYKTEDGETTVPKLYVEWGTQYTFKGVYDEDSGLLKDANERAVNVTAYFSSGVSPETFEVNGTYLYNASTVPLYFAFNTSSPREYWLPEQEGGQTIYIFDTTLTSYTITFLDLAGALEEYAWVSASRYINGTLTVVEKRKVDVEKAFTMSLKNGQKYTIEVEAEAGIPYTFGELLMTSTTSVTLTLKGVEFPKEIEITYKNVRIYATRTRHTGWYSGWLDQNCSGGVASKSVYNTKYYAESYTPTRERQTKISLYVKKVGAPADDLYMEIRKDDNDEPDMSAEGLVASKSLNSGNFSTSLAWVEFDHDDFTVAESTYWIMVKSPSSVDTSNCYKWGYATTDKYSGGVYAESADAGANWTPDSDKDFGFRMYGVDDPEDRLDTITITYQDLLTQTNEVEILINYKNESNAYNATETADTFTHSWTSANATLDYAAVVNVDHAHYGTWPWKQYFPRGMSEAPWGLDWLGKSLPFDTSWIVPALLIIFAAGSFSVLNPEVGAFMAVIAAIVLTYMGWIPIPPGILITAIALAILMGLIYGKRRVET